MPINVIDKDAEYGEDSIKDRGRACVENTILYNLYETVNEEIKNSSIENIGIIADENNDDTDMVLSFFTIVLPLISNANTFLTWYSYELNECSYAYSINERNFR